jgi:hypothetical protein
MTNASPTRPTNSASRLRNKSTTICMRWYALAGIRRNPKRMQAGDRYEQSVPGLGLELVLEMRKLPASVG